MDIPSSFEKELEIIINRYSQERPSNTPDFILAMYLKACLDAYNVAIVRRDEWYLKDLNGRSNTDDTLRCI